MVEFKEPKSKYFVGSNGDSPDRLYFTLLDAKKGDDIYIDVFCKDGHLIYGLKNINGKYTKDF